MSGRKADNLARARESQSFVKGRRQRVEGVDIDADAAAAPGQPLGLGHQSAAQAAPPPRRLDPEMTNIEPAPVGDAIQAGDEDALWIARRDAGSTFVAGAELVRDLIAEPCRNLGRLHFLNGKGDLLNVFALDHDRAVKRVLVTLFWACAAGAATAAGEACRPVEISPTPALASQRVRDYSPIFELCRKDGDSRLAIRRMNVDGQSLLLTVDPQTLQTSLGRADCWRCAATSDAAQAETRYLKALRPHQEAARPAALVNAGLIHGAGDGAFVTGDLCPSRKPLDRSFFEKLAAQGPRTPVTLAVSGAWLQRHRADFAWLREQERAGALAIVWANHSYSHPYVARLQESRNYLMRRGVDLDREIFETEKLIIAQGETPSVFFRFPGLVADGALLERLRSRHLVALGADGWLALGLRPRPGSVVLVHPNGNEPAGLRLFWRLLETGAMPLPLRPINDAP